MEISDLSSKHNIPIKNIIDFFALQKISVYVGIPITLEQRELFEKNIENIKGNVSIENISMDRLTEPKILGKINLPMYNSTRNPYTSSSNKENDEHAGPRLMAAAISFNISKDTLIEFLLSKGFDKDELNSSARLSIEMHDALKAEFLSDKQDKFKRDQITLPKASTLGSNFLKGRISEIIDLNKVKIKYLKSEKVIKNGRVSFIDIVDPNNWVLALKEDWPGYEFTIGNKINFVLKSVTRDGRRMTIAMPLGIDNYGMQTVDKNISLHEDILTHEDNGSSEKIIPQSIIKRTQNLNKEKMETKVTPIQKILFGSPGTGKSHKIDGSDNSYLGQLGIQKKSMDCIKTVFHPEYTYGDFMGKLMPNTNDDGQVEYRFYAGHFLKALGKAYKNIIIAKMDYEKLKGDVEKDYKGEINKSNKNDFTEEQLTVLQSRKDAVPAPNPQNVALVIDEINRGNSAAIFGTTFQLLDRAEDGWSSYHVRISDLENNELLKEISLQYKEYKKNGKIEVKSYEFDGTTCSEKEYNKYIEFVFEDLAENDRISLTGRNIKIPPNLSIIATMNTSDNSIYFMDSAFKRRWDWEFIDITSDDQRMQQSGRKLEDGFDWDDFVDNLNSFIKKYGERIRKIEDKQIGYYFIKGNLIKHEAVKNKLMFFLWDSIFNNDKKPLKELIGLDKTLVTFGDFIRHYDLFINAIKSKSFLQNNVL